MAADLDLTPSEAGVPAGEALQVATRSGHRHHLAILVGLVALLAVLFGLTGAAALVLAGSVAAGFGLTYVSGVSLAPEERLAFGTVLGAMAFCVFAFALALAFGLGVGTVLLALGLTLAASAAGWRRGWGSLDSELQDAWARWRRGEPWPAWLLLAAAWPFTLVLLGRAYAFTEQGLRAGGAWAYADWAAHLTYSGSFAYGANFPPEFPIEPGHRMAYPFMVDLLAATLVPLGSSLTSALVLSSALLALAFPAVVYLAGTRLTGSRGGSALGGLLFTMGGGLGFVRLSEDLRQGGVAVQWHLPRLYTQDPERNYQWLNPVLAWLLPQRSVLFGFSLALIVMALLWNARQRPGWQPFAFTGVAAGAAPLFHLHAFGTVVLLAAFWAGLNRRREWLAFFVPALLLGLPVVFWMAGSGAAEFRLQLWWLADAGGHHDGPLWFWLKNTGLFIPVMAAAHLWRGLLPAGLGIHLAPVWLWFLIPNLLVFQPWDWDNTKFFAYWALFGSLIAGALLVRLAAGGHIGKALATVLFALLILAGALDLARALDYGASSALFSDRSGVEAATWVRDNTEPRAIFLVAPDHNEPVPALGGRRVTAGYPGWLWTYGLSDWAQRTADAGTMLRGEPATPALVRRYSVAYVVIGPHERRLGADRAYWERNGDVVYRGSDYTIYRVAG